MVLLLIFIPAALYLTYKFLLNLYNVFFPKQPLKWGYEEGWFGRGARQDNTDTSIRPFKISVSDDVITDLKNRLERTRFEEPLEESKFNFGFNSDYLRSVIEYWKSKYDWRRQEEEINKYPHFKTRIEGIDVHFLHVKPELPEGSTVKIIPLIMVHGWPGSFFEFQKIIPLLTAVQPGYKYVFEVICPSIPGYGFSEAPHKKGFNARCAARIFLTLMERLGHSHFYAQGGDWGSLITQILAKYYPSRVIGLHLNMFSDTPKSWDLLKAIAVAYFPSLVSKAEYNAFFPIKSHLKELLQESGYFHINATKPDTVGCAMSDSPTGLAAYILEKFSTWTNNSNRNLSDGGLCKKFSLDELLTNVMIYWVNNNFTSSARFYKENIADFGTHEKFPITIPCGIALFPNELLGMPKCLLSQQVKDLISYTVMPRGGHFPAMEEPQLLAEDIWKFVSLVEKRNS